MKNKLHNSEIRKTHMILFGAITDPGGGGGGSGGGGDGGGGGGSGGDTSACIAQMENALAGDVAPNLSISSVITPIDSTNRYQTFTWVIYRGQQSAFQYNSVEVAQEQLIGGAWQFTSIAHSTVYLSGTTAGFQTSYIDTLPPIGEVIGPHKATMTLHFQIRGVTYCFGLPIDGEVSPPNSIASRSFTV